MNKKKLILILVIANVLLLGVGGTLSAYKSAASGSTNNFEYAAIVFNNEEVNSINVDLTDLYPGDTKTISFKVSNNKDGKTSDVTIEYKLVVRTYRNIPTTITIKNSSNQTILTCDSTHGTRSLDGEYVCTSTIQTLSYSDTTDKNFTASITYDDNSSVEYSDQNDFLEIDIISEASANNDGVVEYAYNTLYDAILKDATWRTTISSARSAILLKGTPNFSTSATTDMGMYATSDEDGWVYYYRGNINYNHVIFGGFCWKIVRTTGTGGVKMIYDGAPVNGVCNNTGSSVSIGRAAFEPNDSPATVGYMHGERLRSDFEYLATQRYNTIFSNDVTYNSSTGKYDLDMSNAYEATPSTFSWNSSTINNVINKHYTCLNTQTSCSTVYYVYSIANGTSRCIEYISLSNGKTLADIINQMFTNSPNTISSNVKILVDTWYENNLLDYQPYLEDTIFCNDRSILTYGGWDKDATNNNDVYLPGEGALRFNGWGRIRNYTPSLVCSQFSDKFTVNYGRGNGALTYPVGLLTADEVMMAGITGSLVNTSTYLSENDFYTMTPAVFRDTYMFTGGTTVFHSSGSANIRPVISIKSGVNILGGNGTSNNPYIVDTEN